MENKKDVYTTLSGSYRKQLQKYKSSHRAVSVLRLVVFICWAVAFYFTLQHDLVIVSIVFLGFAGLFIFLLRLSSSFEEKIAFTKALFEINENELKALNRDYSFFQAGKEFIDPDHPYSNDLDIFGENSICQYLNRTCTIGGSEKLAAKLTNPLTEKKEIVSHQEAIKELTDNLEYRQNFLALGKTYKETRENREMILRWAKSDPQFINRKINSVLAAIVPVVTVIALIMAVSGIIPFSVFSLFVVVQWIISVANLKRINHYHSTLGKKIEILYKYARLSEKIEKTDFNSSLLNSIKSGVTGKDKGAGQNIRQLAMIMNAFDSRLNMFVGIILNSILLWDLQCVLRLEQWQKKNRDNIKNWIDAISEIDALESLANYAYNNSDHSYPVINTDKPVWIFREAGHLLLDPKVRVNNDFEIEGFGSFQIITGANMAGKSTFLRTIGVNMVIAMTGAPVCAKSAEIYPVPVFTSMRTNDSIQKNESYFYAELKRLKELADTLKKGEERFIILDEILKGTNSQDKQTGSKAFLEKLIEFSGAGIIATHDVSLGELEHQHPGKIQNLCFEIEINGAEIFFDYKLYQGITKKMNASILMKQMGIV